jgi:peptide methionine sulfoxide reductase MsrA
MEEIYLAGGCLWGVQEFLRHLPGVCQTEVKNVPVPNFWLVPNF